MLQKLFLLTTVVVTFANGQFLQPSCPAGKSAYLSSGFVSYCSPSMTNGMTSACPAGYTCTYTNAGSYICCSGGSSNAPKLGESCDPMMPCATPNSMCAYQEQQPVSSSLNQYYNYTLSYKCKCDWFQGYYQDGSSCTRQRKALGEACTENGGCKSAYSYCRTDTKKFDCRAGTAKEGNACGLTSFKCTDGSDPVKSNNKIMQCTKEPIWNNNMQVNVVTNSDPFNSGMKDVGCNDDSYCVTYDGSYGILGSAPAAGFCCKKPPLKAPQCPNGQPHESSKAPNYGCNSCPFESHFCLQDSRVSGVPVCCPKPCANSDVHNPSDGQCYLPLAHGEQCDVDAQCVLSNSTSYSYNYIPYDAPRVAMKCKAAGAVKKCSCEAGYIENGGKCVQAKCPAGQPRADKDGQLIRCGYSYNMQSSQTSQTCPTDYQCDYSYSVCCPFSVTCLNGDVSTTKCTSSSGCPSGSSCFAGACCKGTGSTFCPNGQLSVGSCVNGLCPTGFTCLNNNSCCATPSG